MGGGGEGEVKAIFNYIFYLLLIFNIALFWLFLLILNADFIYFQGGMAYSFSWFDWDYNTRTKSFFFFKILQIFFSKLNWNSKNYIKKVVWKRIKEGRFFKIFIPKERSHASPAQTRPFGPRCDCHIFKISPHALFNSYGRAWVAFFSWILIFDGQFYSWQIPHQSKIWHCCFQILG